MKKKKEERKIKKQRYLYSEVRKKSSCGINSHVPRTKSVGGLTRK